MNTPAMQQIASWLIFASVIGRMLGVGQQITYGIFFLGFCALVASLQLSLLSKKIALFFVLPIIAIQLPIPLPTHIPPLIRLGAVFAIWIAVHIALSLITMLWEKHLRNNVGQLN